MGTRQPPVLPENRHPRSNGRRVAARPFNHACRRDRREARRNFDVPETSMRPPAVISWLLLSHFPAGIEMLS
jgi:hypothetical protein